MDRRFSLHRRYPVSWPPCRDDDDGDDGDDDDDDDDEGKAPL